MGEGWDEVWAEEGGIAIRFRRKVNGGVIVTILDCSSGIDRTPLAQATVSSWRWDRVVRAVGTTP